MSSPLLVDYLAVDFQTAQAGAGAVEQVSLLIAPGEVLGLIGESGGCEWRLPSCSQALPSLVEVAPGHFARCPIVATDSGNHASSSPK